MSEHAIKQKTINGIKCVDIPDSMWLCPHCGGGPSMPTEDIGTGGLTVDFFDFDEDIPDRWLPLSAPVTCDRLNANSEPCGWSGTVRQVVNAAMKRASLVTCPCCKGNGTVDARTLEKRLKEALEKLRNGR